MKLERSPSRARKARRRPASLLGATVLALAPAAWAQDAPPAPARAQTGQQGEASECEDRIEVRHPGAGMVRIEFANPCRAGEVIRFVHGERELPRVAGPRGDATLFRILDPNVRDVIRLFAEGGVEIVAFEEDENALSGDEARAEVAEAPEAAEENAAPEPAPEDAAAEQCPIRLDASVESGLASVTIEAPCAVGRTALIEYREQPFGFYRVLDEGGRAQVTAPMLDAKASFDVAIEGHGHRSVEAVDPEFANAFRVALVWDDPVDLDLHVIEPGAVARFEGPPGAEEAAGHLRAAAPEAGIGRMIRIDDGILNGEAYVGSKIEAYAAPLAAFAPRAAFALRVGDESRGVTPEGAHCGEGPQAAVPFNLIWSIGGETEMRRYRTARAPCGVSLSLEARYPEIDRILLP